MELYRQFLSLLFFKNLIYSHIISRRGSTKHGSFVESNFKPREAPKLKNQQSKTFV